jgi:glyoxylase-like metal-dependent hydrolase (beta-lactamase superfamily II)
VSGHVVPLVGSTDPWSGGRVTDTARCVLAPNPSPWTLDGTNTWVLRPPGAPRAVVVDPGPDDAGHLAAVQAAADVPIVAVLLTHGHPDHAESARRAGEAWGAPVRALDPAHRLGGEGLVDGDVVDVGDWSVRVVGTPGHSADSVSLVVDHDASLLTGDTVLGRGTSLVAWPDGRLADYLASLERLQEVAAQGVARILPGHGPVVDDPLGRLAAYLAHRRARLDEVAEVMARGVTDPAEIVAIVYADVPKAVWPAAELTVRAQVEYLAGPSA